MVARALIDELITLLERVCRPNPTGAITAEFCARLAAVGGARGLAVYLVPEPGHASLIAAHGIPLDYLRRFPVREPRPFGRLTGDVRGALTGGEAVHVGNMTEDPRTISLSSVALEGRFVTTLAVPLLHGRRVMGVLHAFYGDQVAPVSIQRLARVGPLFGTALSAGSPGAGHVFDALVSGEPLRAGTRRIHATADRYGRHYSVTFFALDAPEVLTQRLGAALTSEADGELGRIVAAEAREADLAGMVGPGEYLVIMPETGQDGAYRQVERILDRFGRRVFAVGDQRIQLSASAGISCFPENGALEGAATVRSARRALRDAAGPTGQRIVAIAARGAAAGD